MDAYIIDCKRIPIGLFGGQYKHLEPEQLLKPLFNYFIDHYPNLLMIDDVIIGNTIGLGGNLARLSLLYAGLSQSIPGVTVDRQCGSGLEAINQACRLIQSGAGHIYFAGGVESISRAPWRIEKPKTLYSNEPMSFYTKAPFAPSDIGDPSMIEAAENVATAFNVSRESQDVFSLNSFNKHQQSKDTLIRDIVPITVQGKKIYKDEGIRNNVTMNKLRKYKPLIHGGTITIGNACRLNDGAALALIVSEAIVREYKLEPLLKFIDATSAGVDPRILGTGPIASTTKLLNKTKLTIEEITSVEFNEAFASQVIASKVALNITDEQLNKDGGALATGHPYAASGAMLVSRLCGRREGIHIATIGIGGGQGISTLFESVNC